MTRLLVRLTSAQRILYFRIAVRIAVCTYRLLNATAPTLPKYHG